ncbi:MAG: hypothetical protein AAGK93_08740, partial [Pseudomonadota bacterium]
GPRLEVDKEAGDAVRLGRAIGTLRLGGWYDLYLPADIEVAPVVGQTLIGSETVLGRFGGAGTDVFERPIETKADVQDDPVPAPDPEPEPEEAELVIDEEAEDSLEALAGETPEAEREDEDEDVSEMFARLRKEARKMQDDE